MQDEMEEITAEFITEAEESLDRIEPLFVELEEKGQDTEMLNDIFRSMHTIKGAAGFLGFQSLVDVAHSSENILKKLRESEIPLSKQLIDVILKSVDMLRLLISHLKEKDGIKEDITTIVKELKEALITAEKGPLKGNAKESPQSFAQVQAEPEAPVANVQPETALKSNATTAASNDISIQTAQGSSQIETPVQETLLAEQNTPAAGKADEQKQKPVESSQRNREGAQNLRVDINRIDKVMDLAGEVVLIRNRLLNISNHFDQTYNNDPQTETLMEIVSFLDRVTSDLQLAVMRIRMQPIKKVFSKFPRLIRDISAPLNKIVDLDIYGEGTEVDKSVIEHIGDPITHILRNSVDHGLESTEERIAKGKPQRGRIVINTYQKGNQIVIEISDDGKGMDVDKIKQKAVEKGLISEDEARKMSDDVATNIIFMPGFSTKEVATQLSGRGVGMDVVKTNISLLNGYVEVTTEKDAGTTFRICIPLTLAIMQALMVEVAGNKYAIPLSPIEETLKITEDDIDSVTGQSVIVIRDKVCPLFDLGKVLGIYTEREFSSTHKYIIVISLGERKFCVSVDKLLGQEEVVIKTLEGVDTKSSNVLGASITGDGKVVFIIDVTGISASLLSVSN